MESLQDALSCNAFAERMGLLTSEVRSELNRFLKQNREPRSEKDSSSWRQLTTAFGPLGFAS